MPLMVSIGGFRRSVMDEMISPMASCSIMTSGLHALAKR
jgi:hypothetical protein